MNRALCVLLALVCTFLPWRGSLANDIQITNLIVHPYSGGNGEVEFDISWQNSWHSDTTPAFWDAAWVFCKIRRNGGDWTHLKLNSSGHTIPSTPQAITTKNGLANTSAAHDAITNPVLGIFMYRASAGMGAFSANDVRLQWSYADNGTSSGDVIEIRVIGIEMVYIPQGTFYAGDGPTTPSWRAFREKQYSSNNPWYITNEDAIATTAGDTGNRYYPGGGDFTGFTIPAAYPKGYDAFYMMKGEVSQGQYVVFFNMLTRTQTTERDITSSVNGGKNTDSILIRNNIRWEGSGDATLNGGTHSGVAMNYISWADLAALLDWSGLRPMSELEFEKAGRGPNAPVSGEYAWGSAVVTGATSIAGDGLASERGQAGSNVAYNYSDGVRGPLRVGSFAKGVTANLRVGSGGGFYGVMELSGNLFERAITVGNSTGRSFQRGLHGDGVLDINGNANVTNWPGTDSIGTGLRGGDWAGPPSDLWLSDRSWAALPVASRGEIFGGRGVRTAPSP